jgi:hypothetical protein
LHAAIASRQARPAALSLVIRLVLLCQKLRRVFREWLRAQNGHRGNICAIATTNRRWSVASSIPCCSKPSFQYDRTTMCRDSLDRAWCSTSPALRTLTEKIRSRAPRSLSDIVLADAVNASSRPKRSCSNLSAVGQVLKLLPTNRNISGRNGSGYSAISGCAGGHRMPVASRRATQASGVFWCIYI